MAFSIKKPVKVKKKKNQKCKYTFFQKNIFFEKILKNKGLANLVKKSQKKDRQMFDFCVFLDYTEIVQKIEERI